MVAKITTFLKKYKQQPMLNNPQTALFTIFIPLNFINTAKIGIFAQHKFIYILCTSPPKKNFAK